MKTVLAASPLGFDRFVANRAIDPLPAITRTRISILRQSTPLPPDGDLEVSNP